MSKTLYGQTWRNKISKIEYRIVGFFWPGDILPNGKFAAFGAGAPKVVWAETLKGKRRYFFYEDDFLEKYEQVFNENNTKEPNDRPQPHADTRD